MFGLDNNEKQLKELLARNGCEASVFKNFKSAYEKVNKRVDAEKNRYVSAKNAVCQIGRIVDDLECFFTEQKSIDLASYARDMKKLQNAYTHEFLVSSQDKEFQSTYQSLMRNLTKLKDGSVNRIMMQSEVENLKAMIKEVVERDDPNLYAYTYFLLSHSDAVLYDMNAKNKRDLIEKRYVGEVVAPVQNAIRRRGDEASIVKVETLLSQMTKYQ